MIREYVGDDRSAIAGAIARMADEAGARFVFTTGGTGLTPDDVTPEATRDAIDREAPGYAETIRAESRAHTPLGILTRGVSGVRGRTLVVNFPGQPQGHRPVLARGGADAGARGGHARTRMIPVFDGHNDSLTRADHGNLAAGRSGGHVDLPRMAEGGMRGGIFAVFTPSPGNDMRLVPRTDGVIEVEPSAEVPQPDAAAHATAAAGRLLELERAGQIRIARDARPTSTPPATARARPAAVLHLEGVEALDPDLEALDLWYGAGLRSLGPGVEPAERLCPRGALHLPVVPRHRARAHRGRATAGGPVRRARGDG